MCTTCTVTLLTLPNFTQQAIGILQANKLTTGVWHLPVQLKAGQLQVAPHPQPLFSSKVAESQTKIHSCSGVSSNACTSLGLFCFLHQYVSVGNFPWSEWRPDAVLHCALNFTCARSFAGGNAPSSKPRNVLSRSRDKQNIRKQAEGSVSA